MSRRVLSETAIDAAAFCMERGTSVFEYPAVFRQKQFGVDAERNIMHGCHDRAGRAQQRDIVLRVGDIYFVGFERLGKRRQHPEGIIGGRWDLPPGEVRPQSGRRSPSSGPRVYSTYSLTVSIAAKAADQAAPVSPVARKAARKCPGINADSHGTTLLSTALQLLKCLITRFFQARRQQRGGFVERVGKRAQVLLDQLQTVRDQLRVGPLLAEAAGGDSRRSPDRSRLSGCAGRRSISCSRHGRP